MSDPQAAMQATVPVPESPDEHCTDDPVPPKKGATEDEWESYRIKLEKYSTNMMAHYEKDKTINGELMWCDFTTMFCKEAIHALDITTLNHWRALLHRKGVHVKQGKGVRRTDALIECMNQEQFIPYAKDPIESRPCRKCGHLNILHLATESCSDCGWAPRVCSYKSKSESECGCMSQDCNCDGELLSF